MNDPSTCPFEPALAAAGALDADEARAFAQHLDGCPACRAETADWSPVVEALAELVPEARPRPSLRQALLARARPASQPWQLWGDVGADDPMFLARADADDWQDTAHEGVVVRRLFVDRVRDRVTMLVKMAPGSSYPPHVHGGPEECYVVAGDLHVGNLLMGAGDYQRVEEGGEHEVQWTEGGCTLFIVSSLGDRLLSA